MKNRELIPECAQLGQRIVRMACDDGGRERADRYARNAGRPESALGFVDVFERPEGIGTERAPALQRNRGLGVGPSHAISPVASELPHHVLAKAVDRAL